MQYDDILILLEELSSPSAVKGMARFGINTDNLLGVSVAELRRIARKTGRNHTLARELWESGLHEARILASMVDDPDFLTSEQMEEWVVDFDSWDVCDQCCSNLFRKSGLARQKAVEWSRREEEFVKRAGFTLMACLAVHDRTAGDREFEDFLSLIRQQAGDGRNYVKKAVNWALRQIGKRNQYLNSLAISMAEEIRTEGTSPGRWIASDALRELRSQAVQSRLGAKEARQSIRESCG